MTADHYLAIFDEHTAEALYLGRTKRIAPAAHRIMLLSLYRGCTFPGCTVPGYGCQVHHVEEGWTVHIRNGRAEWIPPPHLDTGQTRTNFYHHPEPLLAEPEDDDGT